MSVSKGRHLTLLVFDSTILIRAGKDDLSCLTLLAQGQEVCIEVSEVLAIAVLDYSFLFSWFLRQFIANNL